MVKFLLVVIVLAVTIYALTRVIQRRGGTTPHGRPGPRAQSRPKPKMPTGPLGPDDDEEFLRELDRRRLGREDPDG